MAIARTTEKASRTTVPGRARSQLGIGTIVTTLAVLFLVGACSDDGDGAGEVTPEPSSTPAAPAGPSSFDGELVAVMVPAEWTATEHDDRGGVTMDGPDVAVELTAIPTALFDSIFLELPSPADPETLAAVFAPALGPDDGVDEGEVEIIALPGGLRAAAIPAAGPAGEGEVLLFDLGRRGHCRRDRTDRTRALRRCAPGGSLTRGHLRPHRRAAARADEVDGRQRRLVHPDPQPGLVPERQPHRPRRPRPAARDALPAPAELRPMADPDVNFVIQMFGDQPEVGAAYLEAQKQIIGELHRAGVPLLAGTDASAAPGSIRGFELHLELELELLVDHGLSPFDALAAATATAADFPGESGEWGTVAAGTRADLVLLGSNPLDDIGATRQIEGVMAAGTWHPAADLEARLDEVAANYEAESTITMAPFTSQEIGISGVAPMGWTELEPGVWTRSNPDTDPTFLVQQAAPAADAAGFIAAVLANFGAGEPGEVVEVVEVDGVTWEVSSPEADVGLLVATADTDQRVLVVALAARPTEIDELIETVFRPALVAFQEERT